MKLFVASLSVAALALLAPVAAHAQIAGAAASVIAGTQSSAGVINVIGAAASPGGGSSATVNNGLGNPQIIAGQSTIGPTVPTVDRCKHVRSGSLPFGFGAGWTTADEDCKAEEQATWLWRAGQTAAAIERYCDIEGARNAMARSQGYQCVKTQQERAAYAAKNAPRNAPAAQPAPAPVRVAAVFDPTPYPMAADCLMAAQAAGAPFSACAGKR